MVLTSEGIVELDIFDLLESEKITWGRRVEDMIKFSKEFPNYYFRLEVMEKIGETFGVSGITMEKPITRRVFLSMKEIGL